MIVEGQDAASTGGAKEPGQQGRTHPTRFAIMRGRATLGWCGGLGEMRREPGESKRDQRGETDEREEDEPESASTRAPEHQGPHHLGNHRHRHGGEAEMPEGKIGPRPVRFGHNHHCEGAAEGGKPDQGRRDQEPCPAEAAFAQNPRPMTWFGSQVARPGIKQSSTMKPSISSTKGRLPQRISLSGTCGATPRST